MVELLYASYAQLKLIHDIETNPGPSSFRVALKTTSIEPRPTDNNSFYILRSKTASTDWVLDTDYRKATNINFDNAYVNLTPAQIASNGGKVLYNNGDTLEWLSFSDVNIAELSSHANYASFPSSNQSTSKIYLDQATGEFWRWSGSTYVRTDTNQPRLNETNTFTSANTFSAGITVTSGASISGTTTTGTTSTGALTASSITSSGTVNLSGTVTLGNITAGICDVNEIVADQGTSTDVSYTFTGDTNTGIYSSSDGNIDVSGNGTRGVNMNATGVKTVDGSASNCSHGFISSTNSGMYYNGTEPIIANNGSVIAQFKSEGLFINCSGTSNNRGLIMESDGGTDVFIGSSTLVNGVKIITSSRITTDAHIFLSYKFISGGGAYAPLMVSGLSAGSMTIKPTDLSTTNDSSFYYWIIPKS